MDMKSMAKSKRSHTQHHQSRKPHHPPKTSSSSNSSTTAAKQDGKEKKRASPPPSLPSNWGRYEDEEEEVAEVPIDSYSDKPSGLADSKEGVYAVKPKSRGADYSSLIAKAKEARSYYCPSFDDKLPDFCEGAAQMLAVRGEKILLQDRDDDFLMEGEAIGTQEGSFLTLDLKDLAERLSKVDLAKRLFIEPDLLPPQLHGQGTREADYQSPSKTPERRKIERIDSFGELLALYLEEERMAKEQDHVDEDGMMISSNVSSRHDLEQKLESKADVTVSKLDDLESLVARVQVDHVSEKDAKNKLHDVGQVNNTTNIDKQVTKSISEDLEFLDERENPEFTHVTKQDTSSLSKFQAASIEAELDMLLGSFSETKLSGTPLIRPGTSAFYSTGNIASHGASSQQSLGQSSPAFPITTSLDDELDHLLAGSSSLNNKNGLSASTQVPSLSLPQPGSKSKVLEDFDSWMDTL